jgi:hypothetical protein
MKKASMITFLSASVTLVVASLAVLLTPITVYAADCTAKCGNGGQVQCSGFRCTAQDGWGCAAWDSSGRPLIQMPCTDE